MTKVKGFTAELRDHKGSYLFLLISIIFGAFLRLYHHSDWLHFELDQARDLFVGIWIITLGTYVIFKVNKKRKPHKVFHSNDTQKEKLYTPLIIATLLLIIIAHLFFGFYHLNKASYVDEKLWTYGTEQRIEKYYPNILERDWKNTRPSDKPGVTLAAISGIGLLWETPSDFYHNLGDKDALMHMLFVMRLPILLFGSLMILLFYHIMAKLCGTKIGLFTTVMIALSPILIGISRLINPDALMWIFMPLTFFLYFLYIRTKNVMWLYLTGIFLGLSLLTKYIANLLFIFFIIEIFTEAILLKVKKDDLHHYFRQKSIDIAIIIFIALATFAILFPGVWLKPDRLLIGTLWSQAFLPVWKPFLAFIVILLSDHFFFHSKGFTWFIGLFQKISKFIYLIIPSLFIICLIFVLINAYLPTPLIDLETLLAAPKSNSLFSILAIFLSGFYAMIFSISPLILLGLLFGMIALFHARQDKFPQFIIWHILLFALIYYIGSSISLIASTVRYQIVLYPLIFFVSAYGWYWMTLRHTKKNSLYTTLTIVVLISSCYTLFTIKPHYFSFSSPLLPERYIVNPKDMGEGSYEAGTYLNSLPNAKDLKVWSDRNGPCVVFEGYCNASPHEKYFTVNGTDYDYYVISRGSEYRITYLTQERLKKVPTYPLRLDRLYDLAADQAIFETHPGDRSANYIRIIPGDAVVIYEQ